MPPHEHHWKRAIALADMNAFFCSIEQMDHPEWQGKPVGVTNGATGTCIITCSYEARAWGVRTGMRVNRAREICPGFTQIASRPERYAEVSANIMDALLAITPDLEVFSVDEAFLDVTHCQRLHGPPERIARMIKQTIHEASGGLLCSVGMSGDKTTAKFAAKRHKPDGLTLIPPWHAARALADARVTELCGVNQGIGRYLAERGVVRCADMASLPVSELGRRFGNPGRRIWLMSQGLDPEPVTTRVPEPKSIGHGKIMPPDTRDPVVIRTYLLHMAAKVARRLRRHLFQASRFLIALRAARGWLGGKYRCQPPTNDTWEIIRLCQAALSEHWRGEGLFQVQVTALDPRPGGRQGELFDAGSPRRALLNRTIDAINLRYGEFALAPARLLLRSDMPNVIAPAWKPFGHRETILGA
ncbi:MAG: DNA polymerase IV [Candidatus Sedimenticola endophacoides]